MVVPHIFLFLLIGVAAAVLGLGLSYFVVTQLYQETRHRNAIRRRAVWLTAGSQSKASSATAAENSLQMIGITNDELSGSNASWTILSPDQAEQEPMDAHFSAWLKSSKKCVDPNPLVDCADATIVEEASSQDGGKGPTKKHKSFRASHAHEPTFDQPVECPTTSSSSDVESSVAADPTVCCSDIQDAHSIAVQDVWVAESSNNAQCSAQERTAHPEVSWMKGAASKICNKHVVNMAMRLCEGMWCSQGSAQGSMQEKFSEEKGDTELSKIEIHQCGSGDEKAERTHSVAPTSSPDFPDFPVMLEHAPSINPHTLLHNTAYML